MKPNAEQIVTSSSPAPVAADARKLKHNACQQQFRLKRGLPLAFLLLALGASPAHAATITWDGGGGDLSWQNPLNWSGDQVPGPSDDAVINVPTNVTIVCSGNVTIRSVQCHGGLRLATGEFHVTAGSSFVKGPFASFVNFFADGSDAVFSANGPTEIKCGLLARYGGTIRATNLASLIVDSADVTIQGGQPGGGLVDLSEVTNVVSVSGYCLILNAYSGGRVDLRRARVTVDSGLSVAATGPGSVVDLSGLSGEWGGLVPNKPLGLDVGDGGAILIPNVTGLTNVALSLRGNTGIPTAQLRNIRRSCLSAAGTIPDLHAVTNVDETSLRVNDGGKLILTNVPNFSASTWDITFNASLGTGGVVDLSQVTNLVVNNGRLCLGTGTGCRVDLRRARIMAYIVQVQAYNADSIVNLSGLEGEWGPVFPIFSESSLEAWNGAAILIPNLMGLTNLQLVIGGNATLGGELRSIRHCGLIVDSAAPDFNAVTNVDGSMLEAKNGGRLNLSSLKAVTALAGASATRGAAVVLTNLTSLVISNVVATTISGGAGYTPGGLVDLSRVTNLVVVNQLNVQAYNGGRVDLQGVESITGSSANILSDGAGSVIDLSRLSGFLTPLGASSLKVQNGGVILINNSAVFLLANVAVTLPGLIIQPSPAMVLHALPWHSYWVEQRDTRWPDSPWQFVARVPMTTTFQTVAPAPPPNTAFRVWEFVADPPILDLGLAGPAQTQLVLYGATNKTYAMQSTNVLPETAGDWPVLETVSMTNSFRIFPPAAATDAHRFFRAREW